jgi:hypothetical protein
VSSTKLHAVASRISASCFSKSLVQPESGVGVFRGFGPDRFFPEATGVFQPARDCPGTRAHGGWKLLRRQSILSTMYGAGWGNAPSGVPVSELPRRSSNGTIQPTSEGAGSRATAPPGSLNKAEVRAAMRFNERIRKAAHEALAPPPLHDFMTSAEAHGNSVWSWTGRTRSQASAAPAPRLP